MMTSTRVRRSAAVMAALLVLSVVGPAAVAAETTESVSVETDAATNVSTTNATLNGNLTELNGSENATVTFRYWEKGDRSTTVVTEARNVSAEGPFEQNVTGLDSNTTYVYVALAETANASDSGEQVEFTTEAEEAVAVATASPTFVTDRSATLNGELTALTGVDDATVWFEYWVQGDRANNTTTSPQELSAPGTFDASVEGLANNTTYVYVAHAETGNASDNASQVEFTTLAEPVPLGVTTADATDVTNSSATLNGELTGLGDEDNATVWFEYWVQGDRANNTTTSPQEFSAAGSFSADVSGLDNNTTYVYVAHAEANNTTVSGEQVEFTPSAGAEADASSDGPFGQLVSEFVHGLLDSSENSSDDPFGLRISEFVVANNPGNADEKRPDHAGPPWADNNSSVERGPPENVGPAGNQTNTSDDGGPEDAGPDGDQTDDQGPPEHAGGNGGGPPAERGR